MNLQTPIQLYKGVFDKKGSVITVQQAIELIRSKLKLQVEKIRRLHEELEAAKRAGLSDAELKKRRKLIDENKNALPAVTWSGTFAQRKAEQLKNYSGLICIDIDKLPKEQVAALAEKLKKDPYTFLIFISPSGAGIKLLVKVEGNEVDHLQNFLSLESYYQSSYQVEIDPSGKDVSRLCFLSHDPAFLCEPQSLVFGKKPTAEQSKNAQLKKEQLSELQSTGATLDQVKAFTDKLYSFSAGNHNNYIFIFSCNANRKGIDINDTLNYVLSFAGNKQEKEVIASVHSAYHHHKSEHGKYSNHVSTHRKNSAPVTPGKGSGVAGSKNISQHQVQGNGYSNGNGKYTYEPIFWREYEVSKGRGDNKTSIKRMEISREGLSEFLYHHGFHLYRISERGFELCHTEHGISTVVDPHHVKQFTLGWCKQNDQREVREQLRRAQKQLFAFNELDGLEYKALEFKRDTEKESYFYFNNCWVSVNAGGITTHEYKELSGHIWQGNKNKRNFTRVPIEFFKDKGQENEKLNPKNFNCEFAKFVYYIAYNPHAPEENDFTKEDIDSRFECFCSAIGFLLDGYKHPAVRKAVVGIDHKVGDKDEQNGRSGKTLLGSGVGYLKKVTSINGKTFDPKYTFAYEKITADSQVLAFNDMRRNFDLENLFEFIADDYSIIRRNNGYLEFDYYSSPKVYYNSNAIPPGAGSSYRGRVHTIEFSDYFSDAHTPFEEFGHSLFHDWDDSEWNRFFNFMLYCVQVFKYQGLVDYPHANFDTRKLRAEVTQEFIDFMDDSNNAPRNKKIDRNKLQIAYNEIHKELYGEIKKPPTFLKWVKQYCNTRGLRFNPDPNTKDGRYKYNNVEYFVFADTTYQKDSGPPTNDLPFPELPLK